MEDWEKEFLFKYKMLLSSIRDRLDMDITIGETQVVVLSGLLASEKYSHIENLKDYKSSINEVIEEVSEQIKKLSLEEEVIPEEKEEIEKKKEEEKYLTDMQKKVKGIT